MFALWLTFLTMLIVEAVTVLFNQVINVFVSVVAWCHNLFIGLLDLSYFSFVLENLASLFSQELQLFPVELPVLFFFMRVEVWIDLKQVTMQLELLLIHIEVIPAEGLPFVVSISALLFNLMAFLGQITLVLAMAIIVLKLNVIVIVTVFVVNCKVAFASDMMGLLSMGPVGVIVVMEVIVMVVIMMTFFFE